MRFFFFHIALFLWCLPTALMGQSMEKVIDEGFYITLAFNDAHYEQQLQKFGAEDEADFWKDQRQFENKLLEKDPSFYQAYLNGKHIAYGRHQQQCNKDCHHSDLYLRQASYYAVKGTFEIPSELLLSSERTSKLKLIRLQQ